MCCGKCVAAAAAPDRTRLFTDRFAPFTQHKKRHVLECHRRPAGAGAVLARPQHDAHGLLPAGAHCFRHAARTVHLLQCAEDQVHPDVHGAVPLASLHHHDQHRRAPAAGAGPGRPAAAGRPERRAGAVRRLRLLVHVPSLAAIVDLSDKRQVAPQLAAVARLRGHLHVLPVPGADRNVCLCQPGGRVHAELCAQRRQCIRAAQVR